MGFNITARTNIANNEAWKAQAFINFYLPGEQGKPKKLGAIGLKANNPAEAQLIEWLKANPENLGVLLANVTADFREVQTEGNGFSLGAMGKGQQPPAQPEQPRPF